VFYSTTQLFEQLIEGKTLTLQVDSEAQYKSLHGQLRVHKSRNNKRFIAYFDELMTKKVVSGTYDSETHIATFSLTDSVKKTIQWQVVETELQKDTMKESGNN
jgi:hypothetical protein